MVANPDRRKEFVKNSIKFLRQNHFDGLDLDWEYPTFRDGGKVKQNFFTLTPNAKLDTYVIFLGTWQAKLCSTGARIERRIWTRKWKNGKTKTSSYHGCASRNRVHKQGIRHPETYKVSTCSNDITSHINNNCFVRYLDWMNILSYDYHSAFEPAVNHHSPLYPLEEESEYNYDVDLNIVRIVIL